MKWQTKPIGTFCRTGSGGTPSRQQASRFYGGGIPWVKSGELKESVVVETEESITEAALAETSVKLISPGALLVAMYGATVGRVAILGIEATSNQAVCHIIPDESIADQRYLFYALRKQVPRWLEQRVGGAQPNINQQIIRDTEIPLPPLEEQRRIAAILDKADAVRRKRKEAIALTEELLRSAFLEMFGDPATLIRGHDHSYPTGWIKCKLGDQLTLQRGFDITKEQCQEGFYPVISSGGISAYHSEYKALGPGVLLGRKGSVGRVHYVEENYWPHDTTLWVKDFKGNHPLFVYYFFKWFPISQFEASTANPTLNRNRLHPVEVFWPPYELQIRFVSISNLIFKLRKPKERALSESSNLFNSLLQRAFRGEL